MTSGGNNFNDFHENQFTKFRAVLTVLRQNIARDQGFVGAKPPRPPGNYTYEEEDQGCVTAVG